MRVSTHRKTTSSKTTIGRLPALFISPALSKKLDKAIVRPSSKPERQLKFHIDSGFESPAGNPLQVVYMARGASKTGLSITYVDAKTKRFWAQGPGVSGLARGPFKLPAGMVKSLERAAANVGKELVKEVRESYPDSKTKEPLFELHATGSHNKQVRRNLTGGGGGGGFFGGGGS